MSRLQFRLQFRLQYPWFGGTEVLRMADVAPPVPSSHDVLVRVRVSTYNPTDTNKRSGAIRLLYLREPRPYGAGLDVAGDVIAVSAGVSSVRVGDRVLGMTENGDGFVEQTLVRESDTVPAGDSPNCPEAAAIAMSGSTARLIASLAAPGQRGRQDPVGRTGVTRGPRGSHRCDRCSRLCGRVDRTCVVPGPRSGQPQVLAGAELSCVGSWSSSGPEGSRTWVMASSITWVMWWSATE